MQKQQASSIGTGSMPITLTLIIVAILCIQPPAAAGAPNKTDSTGKSPVRATGELEPRLAPENEPEQPAKKPITLFGSLVQIDEDEAKDFNENGRDISLAWDEWRNNFSQSVIMAVTQQLGFAAINLPENTTTWYRCQVTTDRRLINAEITHCSGTLWFDKALLDAVRSLDGRQLLTYPQGSQRKIINIDLGIIRQDKPEQRKLYFGDIEHQRSSTPNRSQPKP